MKMKYFVWQIVILAICGCLWCATYDEFGNRPFNDRVFVQAQWLHPTNKFRDAERGRMADDVIKNHLTVGMTRSNVVTLLGTSDEWWTKQGKTRYYIGDWAGFVDGCDATWVIIEYDGDDKLVQATIGGG